MAFRTNKMPVLQEKSASGSVATFNTALALPLKSCTSLITGYQEGSGTPSPDNVRPLHAFSSADLYFNTINQWDEVAEVGTIDTVTGKNIPNASRLRSTNYILVDPNTTYYINMPSTNNEYILWYEYDSNKNFIRYLYKSNGTTVTTTSDTRFIRFSTVDYGTTYNNDISINYPATDTSYHAFSGATFTFGQSIYQGFIDWKRGVVVGTHAKKVITDITNWEWFGGYKQAYSTNFMVDEPAVAADVSYLKAENLKPVQPAERVNNLNNFIMLTSGGAGIAISVPTGEDITSTAAWIAEHPVTFVYELATPITIPLGGINLLTQQGVNNIWADTGDIDLTYKDLDIAKRGNFREVFKLPS